MPRPFTPLSDEQVRVIKEAIDEGETYREAAWRAGITSRMLRHRIAVGQLVGVAVGRGRGGGPKLWEPTFEELRRRRLIVRSRWTPEVEQARRARERNFAGIWEFDNDSGMAIASQLPGNASVRFVRGDDWGETLDFSIDTTGYTWSASIYSLFTGANVVSPTVSVISASLGQIGLALTDAQTAALQAGTYGLRVTWIAPGDSVRRAAEGICEVLP